MYGNRYGVVGVVIAVVVVVIVDDVVIVVGVGGKSQFVVLHDDVADVSLDSISLE